MRIDVTRHSADRYIAVIEGMPAGIALQRSDAQTDLDRAAEALLFCSAPDAPQVLPRVTVLSGLARGRSSAAPPGVAVNSTRVREPKSVSPRVRSSSMS